MHILHVVGARPNFMKVAPVHRALAAKGVVQSLIHTGQHYDAAMSEVFFGELEIPAPDLNLNAGSGSHAQQTAAIMSRLEPSIVTKKPDVVLVYGDVNSTVAAALVCSKLGIRIGHVEAGLRSFDRSMPEEINRVVTDQLADILFTPSREADDNLIREGVGKGRIFFAGNVMIDTLLNMLPKAEAIYPRMKAALLLDAYGLVTLHRASNVDDETWFISLVEAIDELSRELPLVFPVHPRARQRWSKHLEKCNENLRVIEPLGYLECLALQRYARVIVTDSGGIQEESTYLGTPCLTLRENTERPITLSMGTNVLIGHDLDLLGREFRRSLGATRKQVTHPPLWDGMAAQRIAGILTEQYCYEPEIASHRKDRTEEEASHVLRD